MHDMQHRAPAWRFPGSWLSGRGYRMSDWLDIFDTDSTNQVVRNRSAWAAAGDGLETAGCALDERAARRKKPSTWWYVGVALAAVAVGCVSYALYLHFGHFS